MKSFCYSCPGLTDAYNVWPSVNDRLSSNVGGLDTSNEFIRVYFGVMMTSASLGNLSVGIQIRGPLDFCVAEA